MQVVLALVLILAAAGLLAQQRSTTTVAPASRSSVQSPAFEPEPASLAATGNANLPDAPSYAPRQKVEPNHPSLLSAQFSNSTFSNSTGFSLVFLGGSSGAYGSAQQTDATKTGSGGSCGNGSSGKSSDSGWFNSLLAATSKGGHYCALGEGGVWKRGTYAIGRAFAAHQYDNAASFTNPAEFFAPGLTPGTSANFNPYQAYAYQYDAGQRLATRYASAVGRDTLKNMIREFWPDISNHMHRHP